MDNVKHLVKKNNLHIILNYFCKMYMCEYLIFGDTDYNIFFTGSDIDICLFSDKPEFLCYQLHSFFENSLNKKQFLFDLTIEQKRLKDTGYKLTVMYNNIKLSFCILDIIYKPFFDKLNNIQTLIIKQYYPIFMVIKFLYYKANILSLDTYKTIKKNIYNTSVYKYGIIYKFKTYKLL